MRSIATFGIGLLLFTACDESSTSPEPGLSLDAELRQSLDQWGVIPIGPLSAQPPAKVELGRALFFDKILSGNRDVACATCHHPSTALTDGRSLAVGTGGTGLGPARTLGAAREFVPRSSPTLLNSGLGASYLFWDGRLQSFGPGTFFTDGAGTTLPSNLPSALVAQVFLPVLDRREMRGDRGDVDAFGADNELARLGDTGHSEVWHAIMQRLTAIPAYVEMFAAAFPDVPSNALRFEHAARAVAAFEVQAFTKASSPFDRYLDRDDAALSVQQKRGALLFFGDARCSRCHSGPLLGARSFANVGVPQIGPGFGKDAPHDLGRGSIEGNDFYRFAFRVAPLRNVELTAPYMHSGAYPTLEAVVRHYDDVPEALRTYDVAQLDPRLRHLHHGDEATINDVLSTLDFNLESQLDLEDDEIDDLVAFLESLTDPAARDLTSLVPASVPSGLMVGR